MKPGNLLLQGANSGEESKDEDGNCLHTSVRRVCILF